MRSSPRSGAYTSHPLGLVRLQKALDHALSSAETRARARTVATRVADAAVDVRTRALDLVRPPKWLAARNRAALDQLVRIPGGCDRARVAHTRWVVPSPRASTAGAPLPREVLVVAGGLDQSSGAASEHETGCRRRQPFVPTPGTCGHPLRPEVYPPAA